MITVVIYPVIINDYSEKLHDNSRYNIAVNECPKVLCG